MANVGQNGVPMEKAERFISLLGTAVKDVKIITDSYDSVTKSVDRRKITDTDNAVKISKAETELKKEEYRHDEAKANIELEYKKITEASAAGELKWSMIQDMVKTLVDTSNRINSMDDSVFLSEESRASRNELHRTMIELSKEIIKA